MTDLEKVATWRVRYEEIEAQILETPHADHARILFLLRKIQRVSQQLDSLYRKIGRSIAADISTMQVRQDIVALEEEINRELRTYAQHFLTRARALAEKMIAHGQRGVQLNRLLAAMETLGYDIGSIEQAALESLRQARKIKDMTPVKACIFINLALVKS